MNPPFESHFKSFDHHRLYYQVWKPQKSKAVLIFVHGLNEHSGRYSNPINHFYEVGYTLYLLDHRGHGKSDGLRSYVRNFDDYIKDLHEFIQMVSQSEKGKPIFLIGHSMGGQLVINYVAKHPSLLKGFITSSANIQMAKKVPWPKLKLGLLGAKFFPRFALEGEIDPKWISRDISVVRDYKRDPLVSKKITLKLISELIKNQHNLINLAKKIRVPALILHAGDDHICAVQGSRNFFDELASEDKHLLVYDDCYHELFNEYCKEEVFIDMEDWLEKRL